MRKKCRNKIDKDSKTIFIVSNCMIENPSVQFSPKQSIYQLRKTGGLVVGYLTKLKLTSNKTV